MNCPRCGAPNNDGARFCVSCGLDLGRARQPPAKKNDPWVPVAIVAVVLVVAAMVVAAIFYQPTEGTPGDDNDGSNVPQGSNYAYSLTINQVVYPTAANPYPYDSGIEYLTSSGQKCAAINVTLFNKGSSALSPLFLDWTLWTSDGLTHNPGYALYDIIPDGIQPHSSATFWVDFEIAESATPTKLIFDDWTGPSLTVNL